MKIAIIAPVWPPKIGGIGKVALRQARGLARRGHDVTVFTPKYKESRESVTIGGVLVRFLTPWFHVRNSAFVPQLFFYLRQGNFDTVFLHYPFFGGAEFVWLWKMTSQGSAKFIIKYHHDVIGQGLAKIFFKLHLWLIMPRIINSADLILVSSLDYAYSSVIDSLSQACKLKFTELSFGIDLQRFKPELPDKSWRNKYHLTPQDNVLLFVGGLDKAHYFKGVDILLRAFARLREGYKLQATSYKLLIVGDGDLRSSYEHLARNLGISDNVVFTGFVSDEDLPKYYHLASVLVLPSTDKSEAFGVVLLEAMACGKPVIASSLPGVRALIEGKGTGLVVEPRNIEDLVQKIKIIFSDPVKLTALGKTARSYVETQHDQEKIIQQLEAICQGNGK